MAGYAKMLKQAAQMQKRLMDLQGRLDELKAEGTAGGGMVKAVVNGKKELLSLSISPEVVDPADVAMLEDMVVAAVRQAAAEVERVSRDQISDLTGGMSLPGLGI
ncbi:MAG TPA: YbaB/EbfC family nucleoid-associated protein [bacterium]|nr:YbaB/EbfC family nucleoid-associated protein [bacterium]HPQ65808.1 YbaB/EbfC family nucleoid-associated protein [bacterium]